MNRDDILGGPSRERELNLNEIIGQIIDGRYRLDAEIGVGGMGVVYRATRLLIGDEVAIKILHHDQAALPYSSERFRREAQAAARLKHPNAVNIYDFGISTDGLQYLVMELVEGQSLRDIIKRHGALTPSKAVEVVTQVSAALDEAHRQNIVHRDVKPDNIIINQTGNAICVKVLDFGIAKLRDEMAIHLTQTGSVVGTPHYMSPEHCMGEELDGRSDVYSLGIVLYETLCGTVPFNAPISTAVVVQHVNQPPPPLRAKNPSVTAEMEAVVLRALAKRREARPQTAGALAQELRAALNGEPFTQLHAPLHIHSGPSGKKAEDKGAGVNLMPTVSMGAHLSNNSSLRGQRKTLTWLVGCALALLVAGVGFWLFKLSAPSQQSSANTATTDAISSNDPNKLPATFTRNFIGTTNRDIKIEMNLHRREGNLSGTYFYQPIGRKSMNTNSYSENPVWDGKSDELVMVDIQIKGTIDDEQRYVLDEVDSDGKQIGTFRGQFISPTEMKIDWSGPNGKGVMSCSLKQHGGDSHVGSYRIITKRLKRETKTLEVDLTYPQIEGFTDVGVQDAFNRRVQVPINETFESATKASADHVGEFPYGESRSVAIKYRSERLISFLSSYSSEFGGAHPMHGTSSFNFDLQTGREVKLNDLFMPGTPYLSVISRICTNDVNRQKQKAGMSGEITESETTKVLMEGEIFGVTDQGLLLIFPPYILGSYAEGEYRVFIPYSVLKNMVGENSPLSALVS